MTLKNKVAHTISQNVFPLRVSGRSFRNEVKDLDIWWELRVVILPHIERDGLGI